MLCDLKTHHGAVGDETDESVGRKETERNDQSLLQSLQLVLVDTGVYNIEEDGRDSSWTRESVLDGRVLGEELGREVGSGNVLVVGWERVSLQTEGADPEFTSDIDLTIVSIDSRLSVSSELRSAQSSLHVKWDRPTRSNKSQEVSTPTQ